MGPSFLHGDENSMRLHSIPGASITPFDVGGTLLLEYGDDLPFDEKYPIISFECALELAMGRVIQKYLTMWLRSMKGSLMAAIFSLQEELAALGTRHPIQPNLFTPVFTIMSKG